MVLGKVLSLDDEVQRVADHYIEDIMVQESIASASRVQEYLWKYRLELKEPESLDGGRVHEIALQGAPAEKLMVSRISASHIRLCRPGLMKRKLSSLCGWLTRYYLVAGWLWPYSRFLKRLGSDGAWDGTMCSEVQKLASELLRRAHREDPVKGP